MITIQSDWGEIRNAPIDLLQIELAVRDFYLALSLEEEEMKENIYESKNYLDSARIQVRNLIKPEENEYIREYEKAFYWMLDNLGRLDRRISELREESLKSADFKKQMNDFGELEFSKIPQVVIYLEELKKVMEHLVYRPLRNAHLRYKNISEKEYVKDEKLFIYFLFLELYHVSESLGAISSEKTKTTPKQQIINPYAMASHEERDFERPSEIPRNIETQPINLEEDKQDEERLISNLIGDDVILEEPDEEDVI